jgi:hypothetical protein
MKLIHQAVMAAFFLTTVMPLAVAQDREPLFSVSGFGTLGAVYHERDGAQFRRDVAQPSGAQAYQLSTDVDSMLGVQITAHPTPQFEATLQVLSRNAIERAYLPQVSWAYAKYKPSEGVAIRAGRLGLEMYMQGDSAEIGYANLLMRQPMVFYPRTMDGVDAEYVHPLGDGTLRLKGMAGSMLGKLTYTDLYDAAGSRMWGALAEYAQGSWTGRVSTGKLTLNRELTGVQLDALKTALTMAPNGAAIVSSLSMQNRPLNYTSLALAYDEGPLQGMASYARISTPQWQDQQIFNAQLGYHIGKFTPYVGYAVTRTNKSLIATGIPSGLSPQTDALNLGSDLAQASFKNNQLDLAIGLRYDLSPNASLKFQANRIFYHDPGSITDVNLLTTNYLNRPTRGMSLLSAALEFVF